MQIRENVPISSLTTMRLGGPARFVLELASEDDLLAAFKFIAEHDNLPFWIMGSGANTIGHDSGFPGTIILPRCKGIKILAEDEDQLVIEVMAGEVWDDVVQFACDHQASGIEAMSSIPGTSGAAPVQNIGAYGQDVAAVLRSVRVFDTQEQKLVTLPKSELGMSYRRTRFNTGPDKERYIITAITLELKKTTLQPPFYNSLEAYIAEHHETDFSPSNIRRMVTAIRAAKLPDPAKIASAGSFFKNVNLPADEVTTAEAAGIPIWKNPDGSGKINSGWLIEACGLKGQELFGFRISDKAALVLINEHATTYAELDQARQKIIDIVKAKFGYTLEQEPVEIPEKQV